MDKGILYIENVKYSYEQHKDGLRIRNKTEDQFIPLSDIFSIRKIKVYQWELISYVVLSIFAFTFWWVLGVIFSLYTFLQYWANQRIVLLTNKGQITLKFTNSNDKEKFARGLKSIYPEAFKIKKWFQFRKES